MADNQNLCKCNMCGSILFDENPYRDSPINITTIKKPIEHMVQLHDGGGIYWACPNCSTDEYLMDITDNDF